MRRFQELCCIAPNRSPFRAMFLCACFHMLVGHAHALASDLPDLVDQIKSSIVTVRAYERIDSSVHRLGTGWVYADGLVVTNHHVIEGAARVTLGRAVRGNDGDDVEAIGVAGFDAGNDLAVVRADFGDPAPASLSISETTPRVGERVFVIGNPAGLELTVSDGIVSAIRD